MFPLDEDSITEHLISVMKDEGLLRDDYRLYNKTERREQHGGMSTQLPCTHQQMGSSVAEKSCNQYLTFFSS